MTLMTQFHFHNLTYFHVKEHLMIYNMVGLYPLNLSVFENESGTIRPGTCITVNGVNFGLMLTLRNYKTDIIQSSL